MDRAMRLVVTAALLGLGLVPIRLRAQVPDAGPASESSAVLGDGASTQPASSTFRRLTELYLRAVEDESAIEPALAVIDRAERRTEPGGARPVAAARLTAYRGALITLKAKHGFWPPARLRNVHAGLELLDQAVAKAPDRADIRTLRLLSAYYLPGFFGRKDQVRTDFRRLARLLPRARDQFTGELYDLILCFVVSHGPLEPARRAELERLAGEACE